MNANFHFDSMVSGYLTAAQLADAPEGSSARFTNKERAIARKVCAAFVQTCGALAQTVCELPGYSEEQMGHDFWLTRCGHGVGFRDRRALEVLCDDVPMLRDRNNRPYSPDSETFGEVLAAIAYGTNNAISGFAYPTLEAYRGWLSVMGSAEHCMAGHAPVWEFWKAFKPAQFIIPGPTDDVDGKLYWSNLYGWARRKNATVFNFGEIVNMPLEAGDAEFI